MASLPGTTSFLEMGLRTHECCSPDEEGQLVAGHKAFVWSYILMLLKAATFLSVSVCSAPQERLNMQMLG